MRDVIDVKQQLATLGATEGTLNLIPNTCGYCGVSLEVTPTLTGLACQDRMCVGTRANMLNAMVCALDIKGFGFATCLDIALKVDFATPVQLFTLIGQELTPEHKNVKGLVMELQKHKEMSFSTFLHLASLPNIGTTLSKKIANNVTDPQKFLEQCNIDVIRDNLGIKQEHSTTAFNVARVLTYYQKPLLQAVEGIVWVDTSSEAQDVPTLTVCASDAVGGNFVKKQDFYTYITDKLKGRYNIEIKTSVTKKLDYLFWDGGRETTKVSKAKAHNEKGATIKIMDADTFCNEMGI